MSVPANQAGWADKSLNALETQAMSVQHALAWAQTLGLPRLDAQMLLLHALGRPLNDRAWLLMNNNSHLHADPYCTFTHNVKRRLATEPVAYIT